MNTPHVAHLKQVYVMAAATLTLHLAVAGNVSTDHPSDVTLKDGVYIIHQVFEKEGKLTSSLHCQEALDNTHAILMTTKQPFL